MNKHLIILGIAILLICVGLSGCNEQQNIDTEESSNNYVSKYYTITYKVTGIAHDGVSLTYVNSQGGTEQRSMVELPWEKDLHLMEKGDWIYISAQGKSDCIYITVEIYLDDVRVRDSTSHGEYTIATASGTV